MANLADQINAAGGWSGLAGNPGTYSSAAERANVESKAPATRHLYKPNQYNTVGRKAAQRRAAPKPVFRAPPPKKKQNNALRQLMLENQQLKKKNKLLGNIREMFGFDLDDPWKQLINKTDEETKKRKSAKGKKAADPPAGTVLENVADFLG